jgi:hypothetical protein
MRCPRLSLLLALSLTFGGCGVKKKVDELNDTAVSAVAVVDRGIREIQSESAGWQTVLRHVSEQLPANVSQVIRDDAQNLAQRSVAAAGTEFKCNVDFLSARAVAALERLKARIQGIDPPPLPPAFCHVTPDAIDLKSPPASWSRLTFHGYDLDHSDKKGRQFQLLVLDGNGEKRVIQEDRVGRTTHYQVTVNLGSLAPEMSAKKSVKILASWNDSTDGMPQVVILPWETQRRTDRVPIGARTYMPPKIGRGDADFDTHDNEHMSLEVRGELSVSGSQILCRIYMHAREERDDWTEVGGWSDWAVAYTAPAGWKITNVNPQQASVQTANIAANGLFTYPRPSGEVVSQFNVWGDRDGDEAGNWTRVEVHWHPVDVTL